jgi:hypothetical protein
MKPKERIFVKGDVMTKYQIACFKHAVKRDLRNKLLSPRARNHKIAKSFGPKNEERFLPSYVTNNPWY